MVERLTPAAHRRSERTKLPPLGQHASRLHRRDMTLVGGFL
jgi:hypothetical protein